MKTSSSADTERPVRIPVTKVIRTAACLNGTIWRNNHRNKSQGMDLQNNDQL